MRGDRQENKSRNPKRAGEGKSKDGPKVEFPQAKGLASQQRRLYLHSKLGGKEVLVLLEGGGYVEEVGLCDKKTLLGGEERYNTWICWGEAPRRERRDKSRRYSQMKGKKRA